VVENLAYVSCEDCGHANHLYGLDEENSKVREICLEYNLRYFGQMPYIPELHDADDADAFIIPDVEIDIIENILEAIYGKQAVEDSDNPSDSESHQTDVEA
jgi:hypothetical protein